VTKKLAAFRELVRSLREKNASGIGLVALGEAVLADTGYADMLESEDTPESDARRENLRELVGSMEEFAEEAETPTLSAFLELVTLQSSGDERVDGDALTMMTVHAAKGLEFPAVMVTGLEEQMFPLRGGDLFEDPEEMEEERRLAYVAFTRAERRLVLSYAAVRRIHGQMRMGAPSRFLLEMPADDLHHVGTAPSAREMMEGRIGARSYGGGGYGGGGGYRRSSAPPPPRYGASSPPRVPRMEPSEDGQSYVDRSEGDFDGEGLTRGMKVRHAKFGVGRVMGVAEGIPPRVHVEFPGWGKKTITVDFLEPA
jgi:DNA helicase-2/ATP-dependent DNA helicase PcrA